MRFFSCRFLIFFVYLRCKSAFLSNVKRPLSMTRDVGSRSMKDCHDSMIKQVRHSYKNSKVMKNRILAFILSFMGYSAIGQNIDFNFSGGREDMDLAQGYVAWSFGRVASDTKQFTTESGEKISITISSVPGLQGNGVCTNWWKTGVRDNGYKLVGDMAINVLLSGDGNYVNITKGSSGLQLAIKGLSVGEHTLMAYHSNTDNNGENIAPLDVLVNGRVVAEGVLQRSRGVTPSTTPYSYIRFEVAKADETVIVQYITRPEEGVTYASTAVSINALVFDKHNPLTQAHDFLPENEDYHVAADDGSCRLSWNPSQLAVKHHVMVGTGDEPLKEVACTAETSYVLGDLYSMNLYRWRIDEEDASGNVYQGEELSFRPRQLAFPGAEGYGRFAIGGRGGVVYHVTNLKNDHEPGSFLYGLVDLEGPRTIVFDVSGLIDMNFKDVFVDKYVTIAAQTAPGKGICLKRSNLNICSDDICRFLRAKRGYGETGNAMGMAGANHAIVDHSTAAWGTNETVSGRGAQNISFQYNIIAEALGIADHKNYGPGTNHGYAATIDGRIGSWHHNLLANCYGRNWSMGGGMDGNNTAIGQMDIFNNVVYNWVSRTTDGGCHEVNFVNNYYKMGPDTKRTELFIQEYENVGSPESTWRAYVNGNIRENKDHTLSYDREGDTYKYNLKNGAPAPTYQTFVKAPFFPSYADIHSAKDAFKIVNSYAGAYMPCPDAQHQRVVSETVKGTYTYVGSRSGIKGEIDHEDDCGGFEEYPEEHRAADFDEDQDGIPTWYENIVGTDPAVANHNADPDRDGWTQLEDYLEFMSHPYSVLNAGEKVEVDLAPYFAGFTKSPVYSVEVPADAELVASVSGTSMTLQAGSCSAVVSLKIAVKDSEGSAFVRKYNVAIAGEPSVIEELSLDKEKCPVFDLQGRKASASESGFVISGGKLIKL